MIGNGLFTDQKSHKSPKVKFVEEYQPVPKLAKYEPISEQI